MTTTQVGYGLPPRPYGLSFRPYERKVCEIDEDGDITWLERGEVLGTRSHQQEIAQLYDEGFDAMAIKAAAKSHAKALGVEYIGDIDER